MKDRFTRGFIAGIAGGIAMEITNVINYDIFHIAKMRLLEWASIFVHGNKTTTTGEFVFALMIQILFSGLVGIIFAYLITWLNSKNYILKGIVYGFAIWFASYSIPILFKKINNVATGTALSNIISAVVYGIVLGATLKWLDKRVNLNK